jgi:RimJ/RimL family protein N-acetyltransferase
VRLSPVVLEGSLVRLEPLSLDHLPALAAIGLDEELWRFNPESVGTPERMRAYVERALEEQEEGRSLPFAILLRDDGHVVGSTRYGNVDLANLRVEIGWTWLGRPWQRTGVNTQAKLLLMWHAFEDLGVNRVEFKTDSLNVRSRAALLRIGAVEEGTLRNHMVTESGRIRHTVYFGVTKEEWPGVKERLAALSGGTRLPPRRP